MAARSAAGSLPPSSAAVGAVARVGGAAQFEALSCGPAAVSTSLRFGGGIEGDDDGGGDDDDDACASICQFLLVILLPAEWACSLVHSQEALKGSEAVFMKHVRAAEDHLFLKSKRRQANRARLCTVTTCF